MSLSASALSSAIQAQLASLGWWRNGSTEAIAFCNAIATAVVNHITSSAVVLPTALVAPNGGGPVTGTGTVT